jgi:hypothetical protein
MLSSPDRNLDSFASNVVSNRHNQLAAKVWWETRICLIRFADWLAGGFSWRSSSAHFEAIAVVLLCFWSIRGFVLGERTMRRIVLLSRTYGINPGHIIAIMFYERPSNHDTRRILASDSVHFSMLAFVGDGALCIFSLHYIMDGARSFLCMSGRRSTVM